MIVPFSVDVPIYRWPIANFVVLGLLAVAFVLENALPEETVSLLVLTDWSPAGLFGHQWLHADVVHLVGNGVFLWVFGNAVCAKLGNVAFAALYLAFGLIGGAVHLLVDGRPMIGASGAIHRVVGMFLVLFSLDDG